MFLASITHNENARQVERFCYDYLGIFTSFSLLQALTSLIRHKELKVMHFVAKVNIWRPFRSSHSLLRLWFTLNYL